jgi:hypothetical protein
MEKFKCKSVKLKKFLMQNGLRYTWVDVDPIDNMTYWIFDKDDKFNGYFYVYNLLNKLQK